MRNRAKFRVSNHCRDKAIFGFFQIAAAAILDSYNYKFLRVGCVTSVELHHHAIFHRGRRRNHL